VGDSLCTAAFVKVVVTGAALLSEICIFITSSAISHVVVVPDTFSTRVPFLSKRHVFAFPFASVAFVGVADTGVMGNVPAMVDDFVGGNEGVGLERVRGEGEDVGVSSRGWRRRRYGRVCF
jgi:hypothetical protein